jgi:NADH-quinone oxidoreductase subunit A
MTLLAVLAQTTQAVVEAAAPIGSPPAQWLPIVLLILIGIGFAAGNVIASGIIGPRRQGAVKSSTYESGMVPVGTARKRFNVRFYIVAMIFLVIDVEIVFFYPWATIFPRYATDPILQSQSGLLLLEIIVFVVILLVAYIYAWGKGVFRWD